MDCYTLRLRLGILYFNQKSYIKAKEEFNAALKFNSYDSLLFEYIYYCDVFTGKTEIADIKSNNYPITLKKKLGIKNLKLLNETSLDAGYYSNSSSQLTLPSALKTIGSTPPPIPQPGSPAPMYYRLIEQNKNLDMQFAQLTLDSKLSTRFYLTNSLGYYNLSKEKNILANNTQQTFQTNLIQYDYAITGRYYLNAKYGFNFTYHFNQLSYDKIKNSFNTSIRTYSFYKENAVENNHLVSASLRIHNKKGWFEPGYSFSKIYQSNVHQPKLSFFYFPANKNKLYMNTNIAAVIQSTGKNLVLNQIFGYKTGKVFTPEFSLYLGRLMNYNENNGIIMYNLADDIKLKAALNLYFNLTKNLRFSIYSSYLRRENVSTFTNLRNINSYQVINYNQLTLTGGLSWKF